MPTNSTELYIGPLKFTHEVQKIALSEKKGVSLLETTRTNKNFVVDGGEAESKAQIRLLFTGKDEVETSSNFRKLITLFKSSPIISVKNKLLSEFWKIPSEVYSPAKYNSVKNYLASVAEVNKLIQSDTELNREAYLNQITNSYKIKTGTQIKKPVPIRSQDDIAPSDFNYIATPLDQTLLKEKILPGQIIPVALEKLEMENVPDLPYSVQVTLTIARVDISPVSPNQSLLYLTENGGSSEDPEDAYWLKKWLEIKTDRSITTRLSTQGNIKWFGKTSTGQDIKGLDDELKLQVSYDATYLTYEKSNCILVGENTSLINKFAYMRLAGKTIPTAMHMGSTSRFLSLDLVFNNKDSYDDFEFFCRFKESSDLINKAYERKDRVVGWTVNTPISLIAGSYDEDKVFVPVYVYTETGDSPHLINCRIDLVQNDVKLFETNEITLIEGGTDYQKLKDFFKKVTDQELVFRRLLSTSPDSALSEVLNQSNDSSYTMYNLFWPIEKGITSLKTDSAFGLLNSDTLRAVVMSEYLDPSQKIKAALLNSTIATGKVVANRKLTFWDKFTLEAGTIWKALSSVNLEGKEEAPIYEAIKDVLSSCFLVTAQQSEETIKALSILLTTGYLGNSTVPFKYNSATTELLSLLAKSDISFSEKFKDALFRVIIERSAKNKDLPYIYSTEGIYSAFYKLITKYTLSKDFTDTVEDNRKEITDGIKKHGSNYPDLWLPTYRELFADRWQEFAPTLDDLGIETYSETRDRTLAVLEDDFVNPSVWFYTKRVKTDLRSMAREAVKAANESGPDYSLSLPFNTEDLDEIKKLIEAKTTNPDGSKEHTTASNTLSDIIKKALIEHSKSNPSGFREDYVTLNSKYEGKYYSGSNCIKLYIHHNGNYVLPREVNIPGLGAEIYRVLNETKELKSNGLQRLDADSVYTNTLDKEIKFHRNLDSNNKACVESCIDQIPDDQYSLDRLFPAIRVYLLEKRGNDLIADDTLFNVSNVISVDITLDKQDAPLAVIKLADPLYTLQNDYFSNRNITSKDKESRTILHNIKDPDKDSTMKRYKLVQGRPVQIRMGYGSMAYNLPVVFTGRITEIMPGDQLTIVCQGWKAELSNRQVNFYCDDPKNWGARDLAIQAITYANPEGFGEFYPQHDLNFILKNINPEDVSEAISNSISNGQAIDLEGRGTRSIGERISNWAARLVGLSSNDKLNKGLDTRLKNIWYPDTAANYNNLFGLRSRFGIMPSWHNDSWIVPLQPCWDVLQEASRHAWNCIVDVVPFDGFATIFMGHPDQPYVYTKGNDLSKSYYNKYKKTNTVDLSKKISDLTKLFINSKYYKDAASKSVNSNNLFNIYLRAALAGVPESDKKDKIKEAISLFDFTYFVSYKEFTQEFFYLRFSLPNPNSNPATFLGTDVIQQDSAEALYQKIANSLLPSAKLEQVKDLGVIPNINLIIFCLYFNLEYNEVLRKWPTIEKDLSEMLSRGPDGINYEVEERLNQLSKSNTAKVKALRHLYEELRLSPGASTTIGAIASELQNFPPYTAQLIILKEAFDSTFAVLKDKYPGVLSNRSRAAYFDDEYLRSNTASSELQKLSKDAEPLRTIISRIKTLILEVIKNLSNSPALNEKEVSNYGEYLKSNFIDFKAFVYFFCTYLLESEEAINTIGGTLYSAKSITTLPPNMKVFRVHHFADNERNIIKNNIVATTREMWNTVVIEHPAPGTAESQVGNREELYSIGRINAGVNWVYYPKQEVTGVIGLQFNPALTLSNKKIKVFTELNCQNPDLAAKLACGHLAEGIRKMYRGNLLLMGKNIKPHDRIVLADAYTKMSGPVEVESVVHHWNVDDGYITNISPNAVCDANPGAAILQTAVLETTYQAIFNVTEFVSDALTWATIIATLGAATPLALGKFSVSKGILGLLNNTKNKGLLKTLGTSLKSHVGNLKQVGGSTWNNLKGSLRAGERFNVIKGLISDLGGPAAALLKNEVAIGVAEFGTHMAFKANVIAGFVENSDDVEQLPVVLSPLLFNNTAFTAGLETDDSVWAISSFGFYYSMKQMQKGISLIISDLFGEEI